MPAAGYLARLADLCPHCGNTSYFQPVASYIENLVGSLRGVSAAKCQSCKRFVLVVGVRQMNGGAFTLDSVYPLAKPDDEVDSNVPPPIRADFSEALRCEWIRAYKACVVMCRRTVQAGALKLGAPKNSNLNQQIDWLFDQGKITESLKDFAHEVRLTGNAGAHPDKNSGVVATAPVQNAVEDDALEDVTPQDAQDIVEFTREFLHHVYVMPAKLKARRATASGPANPSNPMNPTNP